MKHSRFLGLLLISGLVLGFTGLVNADELDAQRQYQQQMTMQKSYRLQNAEPNRHRTYSQKVGDKALLGVTNFVTAGAEIPKNVINLANDGDTNVVYAIVGGIFKGMLHAGERATTGLVELITAPIPTEPNIYPKYVWEDFNHDTTYGKAMRLDTNGHHEVNADPSDPNNRPNPNIVPQQ